MNERYSDVINWQRNKRNTNLQRVLFDYYQNMATSSINANIYQSIDKLTGSDNYQDWAMSIQAYLEPLGLWSVLEKPSNGEIEKSEEKTLQVRSCLVVTCSPGARAHFTMKNTAKEIWEILKTMYDSKSVCNVCNTLLELCTTFLDDCDSPNDYVEKKSNAAKRLRAHGVNISDQLVGMLMLMGMPDEQYGPMKMALRNSIPNMTSELAKTTILEEAGQYQGAQSREVHGMYSRANQKNWRRNNNYARSKSSVKRIKCNKCDRFGHMTKDCPNFKNSNRGACANFAEQSYDDHNDSQGDDDDTLPCTNLCVFMSAVAVSVDCCTHAKSATTWILDSGASRHMCTDGSKLKNFRPSKVNFIQTTNSFTVPVTGEGEVYITCKNFQGNLNVLLKNVLCVPQLSTNLVSISCIVNNGAKVKFQENICQVNDEKNRCVMSAKQVSNGIYEIETLHNQPSTTCQQSVSLSATSSTADMVTWHRRLAHLNYRDLSKLLDHAEGIQFSNTKKPFCKGCVFGKHIKSPYVRSNNKASRILELLHTDLCEVSPCSIEGHRYFMVVYDDYSRMIFAFLLKRKSETAETLQDFIIYIQNQTQKSVIEIRSDNGKEYVNKRLQKFFQRARN